MFKNLQVYRLPRNWNMTADRLADAIDSQAFADASSNELMSQGWVEPRGCHEPFVHTVNGQFLLKLATQKKVLPAKAVNELVDKRAAEIEVQQGFAPGKKARKELKERAIDELLPRALSVTNHVSVWIAPINGWLVVDSATASKADDVIKFLLKAVDKMALESLRVQKSPVAVMTAWLESDEVPHNFTIDQDATLRATGESKAQVGYKRHTLEVGEMREHIARGKQCVRLAMTWNSRISFVLTEQLAIKSVKALGIIKENAEVTYNDVERFDNDFALMTGELARMLADLVDALGGEAQHE